MTPVKKPAITATEIDKIIDDFLDKFSKKHQEAYTATMKEYSRSYVLRDTLVGNIGIIAMVAAVAFICTIVLGLCGHDVWKAAIISCIALTLSVAVCVKYTTRYNKAVKNHSDNIKSMQQDLYSALLYTPQDVSGLDMFEWIAEIKDDYARMTPMYKHTTKTSRQDMVHMIRDHITSNYYDSIKNVEDFFKDDTHYEYEYQTKDGDELTFTKLINDKMYDSTKIRASSEDEFTKATDFDFTYLDKHVPIDILQSLKDYT